MRRGDAGAGEWWALVVWSVQVTRGERSRVAPTANARTADTGAFCGRREYIYRSPTTGEASRTYVRGLTGSRAPHRNVAISRQCGQIAGRDGHQLGSPLNCAP